jgi:hypothetical protein
MRCRVPVGCPLRGLGVVSIGGCGYSSIEPCRWRFLCSSPAQCCEVRCELGMLSTSMVVIIVVLICGVFIAVEFSSPVPPAHVRFPLSLPLLHSSFLTTRGNTPSRTRTISKSTPRRCARAADSAERSGGCVRRSCAILARRTAPCWCWGLGAWDLFPWVDIACVVRWGGACVWDAQ